MTLKANPRLDRQLSLADPMVLWRDRAGGGREGLLLTTSACLNPACTDRRIDVGVTKVDDSLVSARLTGRKLVLRVRAGAGEPKGSGFAASIGLDDGTVEPQGQGRDPDGVTWFRSELDAELLAVLRARFEGARREARGAAGERDREVSTLPGVVPPSDPSWPPATERSRLARAGRNDPCPCGSGVKYKRCCLRRAS